MPQHKISSFFSKTKITPYIESVDYYVYTDGACYNNGKKMPEQVMEYILVKMIREMFLK